VTTAPRVRAGAALLLALGLGGPAAADSYPRQTSVDVLHYALSLDLLDGSGAVRGSTRVEFRAREDAVRLLELDFEGMAVESVTAGGRDLRFRREGGRLAVDLAPPLSRHAIGAVTIAYRGRPEKGLAAGTNAHGRPVVFAENWPDRARGWFPCVDHPYDKATVELTVTAPDRFDVVAPGRLVETRALLDGRRVTRWTESVPIPTYSMVVGAAEFAVTHAGEVADVPLSFWAYPQDAAAARRRFDRSALVLRFMIDAVGPYPFEKLAQVESTTSIGGMENASAVFYAEKGFQGPEVSEAPVPHEIAHQWFGDSVTPGDWDHLWISEGFATYFDALFYERLLGADALRERMARAAGKVLEHHRRRAGPLVDPGLADPRDKLNPSTYQKGAWVLHMLRRELGDDAFFRGVRTFYRLHAGGNAVTDDVRRAMEAAAGAPLGAFFRQWCHEPGFPELRVDWRWDARARQAVVTLEQAQATGLFEAPVDLAFATVAGEERRTVRMAERRQVLRLDLPSRPSGLRVDPDVWLLHAATVAGP